LLRPKLCGADEAELAIDLRSDFAHPPSVSD
jgi:hypothetical protein